MGEPAGCPGAPVGGNKPGILTGVLEAQCATLRSRPQRSGLWTGSYPKVRRRHGPPALTLPPARPHGSTNANHTAAATPTRRDPHRGHFHAPATIPRMRRLVLLLCWPQRPRSAVAPALRTRPCHTGTRARPRLSTPAIFHPMPTAARRPAAAGYRWPAVHPVTPSARPGMTHREERGPCADGLKAPITPSIHARHDGRPTVMTAFISSSSGPPARNARPCVVTRRIRQVHPGGGVPSRPPERYTGTTM